MSQSEQVVAWLRNRPDGVCVTRMEYIGRPAARIYDIKATLLRPDETITKVRCRDHGHRTVQWRYVLKRDQSSPDACESCHTPTPYDDLHVVAVSRGSYMQPGEKRLLCDDCLGETDD